MGGFISRIKDNKISYMNLSQSHDNKTYNSDNNDIIKQYMKYLNDSGFIKIKINLKNLSKMLNDLYNKLNLTSDDFKKSTFLKNYKQEDIVKMLQYDDTSSGFNFALLWLLSASTFGLFSIVEEGTLQNLIKEKFSNIYNITESFADTNNSQKMLIVNNDNPTINIIIAKILFSSNYSEFTDFFLNKFISINDTNIKDTKNQLKFLNNILAGLNKNTSHSDIKIATIVNLLFKFGIIWSLQNLGITKVETMDLTSQLIGELLADIPDDKCYFINDDIIDFDPNVCKINITTKNDITNPILITNKSKRSHHKSTHKNKEHFVDIENFENSESNSHNYLYKILIAILIILFIIYLINIYHK